MGSPMVPGNKVPREASLVKGFPALSHILKAVFQAFTK